MPLGSISINPKLNQTTRARINLVLIHLLCIFLVCPINLSLLALVKVAALTQRHFIILEASQLMAAGGAQLMWN